MIIVNTIKRLVKKLKLKPSNKDSSFITLKFLKSYLDFTDNQDDHILQPIVKAANYELKTKLLLVTDDLKLMRKNGMFSRASDVALTFCIARIRRDINYQYNTYDIILKEYHDELEILLNDIKELKVI